MKNLKNIKHIENKKHKLFKNVKPVMDNLLDDEKYSKELFSILKRVRQIWISGGEPLTSETTLKFIEITTQLQIKS